MTCPIIAAIEKKQVRTDLPDFRPGDTVRVHVNIKEGDKERIQVFEGVVIRRSGGSVRETFTVRKISYVAASNVRSPSTRPKSPRSKSRSWVVCVAPNCITSATCAVKPLASRASVHVRRWFPSRAKPLNSLHV